METFGQRLRRLRTTRSFSTSDLAFRVGVTEGAIRQLESGRTKSPSFSIGLMLAKVLDVDPWLLSSGAGLAEDTPAVPQTGSLKERVARLEARMESLERQVVVQSRRSATRR